MIIRSFTKKVAFLTSIALLAGSAQAQWSLDNSASTLSFVTVKADHVGEVHTFDQLSGSIDDRGNVEIMVELASVNTLIDIRNERMQNMLFETNLFPRAMITGDVDLASFVEMSPGASITAQVEFELDIHGVSNSYNTELIVTRLANGVFASTSKPIIVTAASHGLVDGVEALREIAGLPSISRSVPVTFNVVFEESE
jgi:polyisoprenoid-binding protein YceI